MADAKTAEPVAAEADAPEPVAAEPEVAVRTTKMPLRKDEPQYYKNAPYSSRFPQQNQTNRCWAAYVQHKIATKKFGGDSKEALKQKALYTTMCPHAWVRSLPLSHEVETTRGLSPLSRPLRVLAPLPLLTRKISTGITNIFIIALLRGSLAAEDV